MKKIMIFAAVVATLADTTAAYAVGGTINFTGNIMEKGCEVETNSKTQEVALATVAAATFLAKGDTAGATQFIINFKSCPTEVKKAAIRFDGASSSDSQILALSSDQTAKNVGVAIYEADSTTLIPLYQDSKTFDLSSAATTSVSFVAKYYALAVPVTAGSANAAASFTVTYP